MKTKTLTILAALGVLGVVGYSLGTRLLHASAFRSFTATMTTTTYSADFPTLSLTIAEDVAVRTDGSSVRIQYPHGTRMIDGMPATWRGVFDFSTGRLTVVHPEISATVTTKLGAIEHAVQYQPQYTCPGSGAGEILGFDVQLSQKTENLIPSPGPEPHRETTKTWAAPALGCFVLRQEELTEKLISTGWVMDKSVVRQAVKAAYEPVDSYFEIPANYSEMATGDALVLLHQMHPDTYPSEPQSARVQQLNKLYIANRP
jgi:hypothetical protein